MRRLLHAVLALCAVSVVGAGIAAAGPSPARKCQAAKLKAAGKACECRHAVAAKALASGATPDFTKCAGKLADAFAKAEAKGSCPATGEDATVDGRLVDLVTDLSTSLQASGATGDAAACVAAKLKAAGKECACLQKVQATATLKGMTPDFSTCDAKLAAAYGKAETKGAGACPTSGDGGTVGDDVRASCAEVEADVADRDTSTYSQPGPYGVGVRTVTLIDTLRATPPNGSYAGAPERTLVTEIWYPAAPNGVNEASNVAIAPNGGAFPLIVRAHGFSGLRRDSTYIVRQLASWGYVVVAPDFPLSNLSAPGGPTLADIGNQAGDVSFLIDHFLAENANGTSFLFERIDASRIGAIGHSLGGATVLLATYHATLRDPRIDAAVALSPLGCMFLDGFFDASTAPLLIEGGTVDMITRYASNHLQPYGFVNAPKYLMTFDGGTHLGFSDRLLFNQNENGDDAVGCSIFVGPGDPRPVTFEANLPPDFLGGPALGIDPSGSLCEPICPLPPPSFMLHGRQNALAKAGSVAFFEAKLRGSVSGGRMITGRIDADNADLSLAYEE
ncbi:MAG: alpha/beta fold hydrolase [Deltaproteobacteria bacterium]|nr:alpha/beta fold hydrolase [Deltaproteobacteria bacterium]